MLNDLIILILNFFIDICLVLVIKSDLRKKILNKQKQSVKSHAVQTNLEKRKLREEEDKKTSVEKKANAMMVMSFFIYILCRTPELVGVFTLYYFSKISEKYCGSFILCTLIANLIEYMYMLSYIFNIFIYYNFSTFFNKGLKNFFGLK